VINGQADVLRDEGEAYAGRLRAGGVPVTSVRYDGTIHDFVVLNALRDSQAAKAATAQGGEFLRAILRDKQPARCCQVSRTSEMECTHE
jgi:acetyl esterase